MLTAAFVSFGVVFVAELGDRSQLMTMTYALRHRWWEVLSGIAIASCLVQGLSVAIGHFLRLSLPERPIALAAAIAFLLFAAWTWREKPSDEAMPAGAPQPRFVLLAVISSYVLAELGDKTMLATVALASDHDWAGVWIGATAAMVVADGMAIAVGALLHRRLPERLLHAVASVLFLLFGLWLLFDTALGMRLVAVSVTTATAVLAAAVGVAVYARRARRRGPEEQPQGPAEGRHGAGQQMPLWLRSFPCRVAYDRPREQCRVRTLRLSR